MQLKQTYPKKYSKKRLKARLDDYREFFTQELGFRKKMNSKAKIS